MDPGARVRVTSLEWTGRGNRRDGQKARVSERPPDTFSCFPKVECCFKKLRCQKKPVFREHVLGTMKWFSVIKRYGSINRNDTWEDILVHKTAISQINCPQTRRRSIGEGTIKEFGIGVMSKGREADNVTSRNGKRVQGSPFARRNQRTQGRRFLRHRHERPSASLAKGGTPAASIDHSMLTGNLTALGRCLFAPTTPLGAVSHVPEALHGLPSYVIATRHTTFKKTTISAHQEAIKIPEQKRLQDRGTAELMAQKPDLALYRGSETTTYQITKTHQQGSLERC